MVEHAYMGHHTQLEEHMDKVLNVHNTLGPGEALLEGGGVRALKVFAKCTRESEDVLKVIRQRLSTCLQLRTVATPAEPPSLLSPHMQKRCEVSH